MTTLDSPFPNQESAKKIMKIQMKAMQWALEDG